MQKQSLNLINKNRKKQFYNKIEKEQVSRSEKSSMVYGSGLGGLIGSITGSSDKSDNQKQNDLSDLYAEYETLENGYNMQLHIADMIDALTYPNSGDFELFAAENNNESGGSDVNVVAGQETTPSNGGAVAWDPRLSRVDAFVSDNQFIVPFASDTAASAYYDQLFTIEKAAYEEATGKSSGSSATNVTSGANKGDSNVSSSNASASDRIPTNKNQVEELKKDPNMYGVQSLMNPYSVTKLVGGLTNGTNGEEMQSHMYDIRDSKRFYDNAGSVDGDPIVAQASDITSINNPTTQNIIAWSNKDKWGRTPYSFQDFVFCKYWNVIPNNRLITFRKYAVPTYDNLNFPNMTLDDGKSANEQNVAAPIATVVTYYGGDSANKLNDFLKFTTGTKWRDINADVHKVQGDTGSNPRAVIDSMFESGSGFGGQGSKSNIVNSFLGTAGGLTGQYLSFGKFVGLLDPNGYSGHSQAAWERLTEANMDPTENLYSNKIVGPVNRIQSVKAREAGIEFSQAFTLTCEYISRPIGGINTKSAMLDILANCMEIASPEAVFWGGGYRFMIKPHMYPFKRGAGSNTIMEKLYAGNIFGTKGAIAAGLDGLLNFGKKDANSSFEWSTVTERLGDVLSQTVGAIGSMLQSVGSALMGDVPSLGSWIKGAGDAVNGAVGEDAAAAGKAKMNAMFSNINKMWKDKVIQETAQPNIQGMKSILSGEPTGNWHLTLGNPLNPIMVVGNLICTKMEVTFGEELGPDDFPLEMKVVYSIEHAMARDKAGIQSMFNRGSGKIYKLPDYIKALSDYETKVDPFTGNKADRTSDGWRPSKFIHASTVMAMGNASGYQTYKIEKGKALANRGNAATTMIAKFTPVDPQTAYQVVGQKNAGIIANENARVTIYGNLFTRKYNDN